jgi:NADP+-dependent farnesol dehydrogenase
MLKWKGKFAIVTGASSGIGKSVAITLAKNGINVIALARRVDKIEDYAKEIVGDDFGKIYAKKCDVSDIQMIKDTVQWIEENFGSVNILINNAGVSKYVQMKLTKFKILI